MKLKNKTLMHKMSLALAPVALLMTVQAASAGELDSLGAALQGGKVNFASQYRYESVETPKTTTGNAKASTLGTRLGYETGDFHDFAANVQVQGVWGNKQYADGQANSGQTAGLNTVNDPAGVGVSQAHLIYRGIADTTIKQGRQLIRYDDDRWVGNVDWRQNWQTFDASTITNKSLANTTIQAAYVTNVNRPATDGAAVGLGGISVGNTHMKSTLLNINNKSLGFADVVAYSYRLDYTNTANAQAATGTNANFGSTNTTGLKLAGNDVALGSDFKGGWVVEYAEQRDFKANTTDYSAKYTNLNAHAGNGTMGDVRVGQEVLGSHNGASVQTPLSTLFAFNGWADKFLVTPTSGLKDSYIKYRNNAYGIVLGGDWHDFKSDVGGSKYGRELDLIAEKQIDKMFAVGARAARFKADSNGTTATTITTGGVVFTDTNKMWVYGSFKF